MILALHIQVVDTLIEQMPLNTPFPHIPDLQLSNVKYFRNIYLNLVDQLLI